MLLFAVSEVPGRDMTCWPAQTVGPKVARGGGWRSGPYRREQPVRTRTTFGPALAPVRAGCRSLRDHPHSGRAGRARARPNGVYRPCAAHTGRGARRGVFGSTCSPALALRAISSADIRPGPTRLQRARFALSRSTRSWVLAEEGRSLVPLARDPWSDQHAPRDPSVWVRLRRHTHGPPCLRFAQTALRRNHLVILLGPQQAVGASCLSIK